MSRTLSVLALAWIALSWLHVPAAHAEVRVWQETLLSDGKPCRLQLRAEYDPPERHADSPWPHARFTLDADCLPPGWQSRAALRVVQRNGSVVYAIDESFACQRNGGSGWERCELDEVPIAGLYRRVWGPIRLASPDLARLHAQERQLLAETRSSARYETYRDTWSEGLWLRRFCGPPQEVVHHFERWQACLARMRGHWQQLFDANEALDYPPFEPASTEGASSRASQRSK